MSLILVDIGAPPAAPVTPAPVYWAARFGQPIITTTPPAAPGSFAVVSVPGGVLLSVAASAVQLATYVFQRAPDVSGSPGTWATIASQAGTYYTDTTTNTATHWYRVRVVAPNARPGDWTTPLSSSITPVPTVGSVTTAQDAADAAQSDADTAQGTADTATNLANAAQTAANAAQTYAQSQATSLQSQVDVITGQVGDIMSADEWSSTVTYPLGDLVQSGGYLYRSLQAGNLNHAVSSTAWWEKIGQYTSLGGAVSDVIVRVSQAELDIDGHASDLNLLGAHNAGKTAFILDQGSVQVGSQTLAQYITSVQTSVGGVDARVDSEALTRASADTALGQRIDVTEARLDVETFVADGDFELDNGSWTLQQYIENSAWHDGAGAYINTSIHSPSGAKRLRFDGPHVAGRFYRGANSVRVGCEGDEDLLLSFTQQGYFGWDGQCGFQIRCMDETFSSIQYLGDVSAWPSGNRQREVLITTPTATRWVEVWYAFEDSTTGTACLDNVSVRRVDKRVGANATAISATQATVSQHGTDITAHTQSIQSNTTAIGTKASSASVSSLSNTVSQHAGQITANANNISAVSLRMPSGSGQVATAASVSAVGTQLDASYTLSLDVNGNVSGLYAQSTGTSSSLVFDFDSVSFTNSDGSFQIEGGRVISKGGGYMSVQGKPFGTSDQFLQWFGPDQTNLANCDTASALMYLTTSGTVYAPGLVTGNLVYNSTMSGSIGASRTATADVTTTVGNPKQVTVNYASGVQVLSPSGHSASVTIELWRKIGAGSWAKLTHKALTGSVRSETIFPPPSKPPFANYYLEVFGQILYTDNSTTQDDISYQLRLSSYSTTDAPTGQSLTIKSVESVS